LVIPLKWYLDLQMVIQAPDKLIVVLCVKMVFSPWKYNYEQKTHIVMDFCMVTLTILSQIKDEFLWWLQNLANSNHTI
jgi:hypothetical protein